MTISMTSTGGKFVAQLPNTLTDTDKKFDHDNDSDTSGLTVNQFSDGQQTIYLSTEQLETGTKLYLLNPKNLDDITAGFNPSNLTISGMNTSSLELQGGLSFISSALGGSFSTRKHLVPPQLQSMPETIRQMQLHKH